MSYIYPGKSPGNDGLPGTSEDEVRSLWDAHDVQSRGFLDAAELRRLLDSLRKDGTGVPGDLPGFSQLSHLL